MDAWLSECVPCGWAAPHATQDEAIAAAQVHLMESHQDLLLLPGDVRAREQGDKIIAHVQYRTVLEPPQETLPIVTDPELEA